MAIREFALMNVHLVLVMIRKITYVMTLPFKIARFVHLALFASNVKVDIINTILNAMLNVQAIPVMI